LSTTLKAAVLKEETLDKLDIRLGRVIEASLEPSAPKKSYKLVIDFGKFGIKTSVAQLTQHSLEDIKGQQVIAVLNFSPRQIGDVNSEVLVLGVQYPKAESGEATFMVPACEGKLGSKLM
jgi:tRNA-binding protein